MRWELALLRHLGRRRFPTIAPLTRSDGAPHGAFGGMPAVLYPYVAGTTAAPPRSTRAARWRRRATTIGRLHSLTRA